MQAVQSGSGWKKRAKIASRWQSEIRESVSPRSSSRRSSPNLHESAGLDSLTTAKVRDSDWRSRNGLSKRMRVRFQSTVKWAGAAYFASGFPRERYNAGTRSGTSVVGEATKEQLLPSGCSKRESGRISAKLASHSQRFCVQASSSLIAKAAPQVGNEILKEISGVRGPRTSQGAFDAVL